MAARTKEPTIDDLSRQIETLKSDIAKLTGLIGDLGRAKAGEAAEAARGAAGQLRSEAERRAQAAGQAASDSADAALEAVRRQPVNALAIAVGVGFLVGLITGRK